MLLSYECNPDCLILPAVTRFARITGDIHALSAADVRLIALAHSLHLARHGCNDLNTEPQPPRPVGKAKAGGRRLPGWGARGGTWKDLDDMDDAALDAQELTDSAQLPYGLIIPWINWLCKKSGAATASCYFHRVAVCHYSGNWQARCFQQPKNFVRVLMATCRLDLDWSVPKVAFQKLLTASAIETTV